MGSKLFFTPGPSHLYPGTQRWISEALSSSIPSLSHRDATFNKIYASTEQNLRQLMQIPSNYHVFFLSSATEAMERIIQNCVAETSLHYVNGAFAQRFFNIAQQLGKRTTVVQTEPGKGFFTEGLNLPSTELICFTHNETSTGVSLELELISRTKQLQPSALLAVDIVSSAPIVDLDLTQVDLAFFSVQKCFGLPSGLGVLTVSPDAMEKALQLEQSGRSVGSYHRFSELAKASSGLSTPATPNVLGIYLMGRVAEAMLDKTIDEIRKETSIKASLIYEFLESHPTLDHFVAHPPHRSPTVIVADAPSGSLNLIKHSEKHNIVVGGGYGKHKDRHLRIANFPSLGMKETRHFLEVLDNYKPNAYKQKTF